MSIWIICGTIFNQAQGQLIENLCPQHRSAAAEGVISVTSPNFNNTTYIHPQYPQETVGIDPSEHSLEPLTGDGNLIYPNTPQQPVQHREYNSWRNIQHAIEDLNIINILERPFEDNSTLLHKNGMEIVNGELRKIEIHEII